MIEEEKEVKNKIDELYKKQCKATTESDKRDYWLAHTKLWVSIRSPTFYRGPFL